MAPVFESSAAASSVAVAPPWTRSSARSRLRNGWASVRRARDEEDGVVGGMLSFPRNGRPTVHSYYAQIMCRRGSAPRKQRLTCNDSDFGRILTPR
ncbi:hypothetical protein [Ornithinimicrobium kibberense]|uniref:hypothetical protein n=1 Tax=Ornithinimicrobium kibberense TaxID=282060 RepID=UPI00361916C2